MKQNYKLTATALKNGKTLYQVIDETGKVISKRTSTRNYVACTINGEFYFGRIDLIGKGDHGQRMSSIMDCKVNTLEKYEQVIKKGIRDIRLANKMNLDCYRRYSTQEQLNEPIKDYQYDLLVKFEGKEVADSCKTQWDYQVATLNDERGIKNYMERVGDFDTWKARREAWVAEVEPQMVIAYREK